MTARRMAAMVATAAGIAAAVCSTEPAQAAPLPQVTPFGTTLFTFGDANFCGGAISVGLEAAPHAPGHVLAHVTPTGYLHGPCGNHVALGWLGSQGLRSTDVYVHSDTRPGHTVTTDLWVGSGVAKVMADSWPIQGSFAEWYLYVP
ncbi:hypothetical protein KO481_12245 [Nocardia sp. NEAU-G5]|jgi:hypothetical protein|uniref:Lipoprotein n=1 Tax=Nocardia albiluteola TaxID=2842303 RepID=A0ABS6AZ65_9NOCA|nr:hypothetical protein [Nocardia albiluteola]MBU3062294.1 hypothetical protein [Nocardia albiluteola]